MKRLLLIFILISSCSKVKTYENYDFTTVFESTKGKETATYTEIIEYYKALAENYPEIQIDSLGLTDSGKPLHFVTYNPSASGANFEELRKTKSILFINNGIHPGESDGIDATMMLFRDLATEKIPSPDKLIVVSIPVYNVGGSLNRNSGTRTNQNGPLSYGFRGNARNFDLNRDFVKADSRNARSFARLFHKVQPHMFIDTHVSNGADYQYTLTHLFTQHNKLSGPQGDYLHQQLMPKLEQKLKEENWDITPYVNLFNRVPETGFSQFMDYPRYSTGYTTMFNSLGMMVETHMLKPYKKRVEGTYQLLLSMIDIMQDEDQLFKALKEDQQQYWLSEEYYPTKWELDTTRSSILQFKGYQGSYIQSPLTGGQRLKYDRNRPFVKPTTYSNYFKAVDSVKIPEAYIIPKGWHEVIDRLSENNIDWYSFKNDTTVLVETYRIAQYRSRNRPYEGHYSHYSTSVQTESVELRFEKGDIYIPTQQAGIRYLLETLEPAATDSFFNWNYFDTILQQKEGFSPYVWEDKAIELLRAKPQLQIDFNLKKTYDKEFADNWYAQLQWLHRQSGNYEKAHMRYPVYRVLKSAP